ncbi:MFS transporter [Streptomyces sp. NPDC058656]|uniref:MFS transporter n=1 Tax=Streptomyces sp. NPDC058656 TaxID=3346578 RepID=UPI003650C96D
MTAEQSHVPAAEPGNGDRRTWIGVDHPRYKWVALTNTTVGMLLATINSSIVLISLPGIFTGIRLDPLEPANVSYLLWMLMGYMLVTAVLVVALGRLGDMMGRVRIYNAGFLIFTLTSVVLSLDPFHGGSGALWLIGWRIVQAVGGSMLMANSAAILTDAFPARQRGMALGVNMVAGIAGSFFGLVLGGALVTWNWRSVFWVNVPIGLIGTVWAYKSLHETGVRRPGRMDWWGNITFAVGLSALLAGITYGIQPYGGHTMGWTNPWVLAGLIGGVAMLAVFCVVEVRVAEPMFPLRLFRNPAFAGGNAATLLGSIARGGLQFMLIIWLQGIWLPLHGYDYAHTLSSGLTAQGVPAHAAHTVAELPPVGVLFAAFLGYNPIQHLLGPDVLGHLSPTASAHLTGREFFPHLISEPFHDGLVIVFSLAIAMSLAAAAASLIRGRTQALPTSPTSVTPTAAAPAQAAVEAGSATPPALRLRGRVRGSAGEPLAHATLTLVDRYGHQKDIVRSGQDGTYELTSAEPGSHMLVVSAKGHEPRAVQVTTGAEPVLSDLALTAVCGVQGTVRQAHTDHTPD